MSGFLKKFFGKKTEPTELSEEDYDRDYEAKWAGLERLLGPMHDQVLHALVPFAAGGPLVMNCFTKGVPGTAFATMELIEPDGSGPLPNSVGTCELVAFTKHPFEAADEEEPKKTPTPFTAIEDRIVGLLTNIGSYSFEAVLEPKDTCEIPLEDDKERACMVFDEFTKDGSGLEYSGRRHCLLLCIEIFRDEMDFAREHGSPALFDKLKTAGHFPYSDLDRESVA